MVGVIGYNQIDRALAKVSIGYWLAERWQGNGIITRACQALIHHAFEEMGMEKVEISAATDNEPSRAVCERLGMQQEGSPAVPSGWPTASWITFTTACCAMSGSGRGSLMALPHLCTARCQLTILPPNGPI